MSKEADLVQAHPEGEVQIAENQPAATGTSLDTFAGKIHVKWAPEATVSSLGLMPFFIEFLNKYPLNALARRRFVPAIGNENKLNLLDIVMVVRLARIPVSDVDGEEFPEPFRRPRVWRENGGDCETCGTCDKRTTVKGVLEHGKATLRCIKDIMIPGPCQKYS